MIGGVGVDVVDVPGLRAQLEDPASALLAEAFTPGERRDSTGRAGGDPVRHLAARYAAKEAFIKAWSTANWGSAPVLPGVELRDIEVITDRWGRPALRVHGAVEQALGGLGPLQLHLSLSHDGPFAAAFVVLELADRQGGEA